MEDKCPRCHHRNRQTARYCARCGMVLGAGGGARPGRIAHPHPRPAPVGSTKAHGAADLWYRWESAWGGPHAGSEGIAVLVYNAGYSLAHATIRLIGTDASGQTRLELDRSVASLPQGQEIRIEIPSFEVSGKLSTVQATLTGADFAGDGSV